MQPSKQARAEKQARGFAVVANEVKELAKQTAKATEEISLKIEAHQDVTKGAVTAIEEIGAIINQINDISNSIASAVEEQTVTTNEIGSQCDRSGSGRQRHRQKTSAEWLRQPRTQHRELTTRRRPLWN